MRTPSDFSKPGGARRGVALVIALVFIVLFSGLVVAYLGRITASRRLSNSGLNQSRADNLAQSALEMILGDLKQEIVNGSTPLKSGGSVVYLPAANVSLLPVRMAVAALAGTNAIPNLIRTSSASPLPAPAVVAGLPSAVLSTGTSVNFRSITPARWNSHYLIPRKNPSSTATDSEPLAVFTDSSLVPAWVFVTNQGPAVLTSPTSSVIGRYAYAIYDEGGLLDVNVAGYPTNATADQYARKSVLAYADLSKIGLSTSAINDLVGWRNAASAQLSGSFGGFTADATAAARFASCVLGATNGFLTTSGATCGGRTDQIFPSRQALLAYRRSTGFSQSALQYLATFSRANNAPSWGPATPEGSSVDYAARATGGTAANPLFPGLLVTGTFTRPDGSQAQPGEPLLKRRFPLSRLALLAGAPAVVDESSAIYRYFGLTRDSADAPWVYAHGAANRILKLGEVQTAAREPDFFELLQACILEGSLGKSLGNTWIASRSADENTCLQILQIGANIIDQYDADSYPTRILLDGVECDGIENLPYLSRVWDQYYRPSVDPGSVGHWFLGEIWNPHQNAASPPSAPSRFRFVAEGGLYLKIGYAVGGVAAPFALSPVTALSSSSASGGVQFVVSSICSFSSPSLLSSANATATGNDAVTDGTNSFRGIFTAKAACPCATVSLWNGQAGYGGQWVGQPGVSFALQYWDGAHWVAYSRLGNANARGASGMWWDAANMPAGVMIAPGNASGGGYYAKIDPRSNRFGILYGYPRSTGSRHELPGETLRVDSLALAPETGWNLFGGLPAPSETSPGWSPVLTDSNGSYRAFGQLTENKAALSTWYADPDGVVRAGDAAYSSGGYGQMLDTKNAWPAGMLSRPILLNRPFRSVAEMSYAFRDVPFKSIDFFTRESADAALLDVFCLNESPSSGLTAGLINLNTRQQPVLKAMLSGVLKNELDLAMRASGAEAENLATRIVAITGTNPLANRSELATRVAAALQSADFTSSTPSATADAAIKTRRECVVRALADAGDTRTWNLFIDVIAQTGRYFRGATSLAQFNVEGERRYWLHVAIDRYTGQVIAQSLEPVDE